VKTTLPRSSGHRVESPGREGGRLPTVVRDERPPAARFHEALIDADTFEDLSRTWQAILKAEQNRPDLRIVGNAYPAEMEHIGGTSTPLRSLSGRPPRARPHGPDGAAPAGAARSLPRR
jgi:hypothetical protein